MNYEKLREKELKLKREINRIDNLNYSCGLKSLTKLQKFEKELLDVQKTIHHIKVNKAKTKKG